MTLDDFVGLSPRPNRFPHASSGYQPQIILAWLSRKSIVFPHYCMESFEDSPDADRHGGYSILR